MPVTTNTRKLAALLGASGVGIGTDGTLTATHIKASGAAADMATQAEVDAVGAPLKEDIAILSFQSATNGSLAKYNLADQIVDDFQDASGVDAATSTNEFRHDSENYYSGKAAGNYFGNGNLGTCTFGASSITQTGHTVEIDTVLGTGGKVGGPGKSSYGGNSQTTALTNPVPYGDSACYEGKVLNPVGDYDGDMWVANFEALTIDASVTLTTNRPCRGMLIYVKGNCVVNGSLSMTCRGAAANPSDAGGSDQAETNSAGMQLAMLKSGGSQSLAAPTFAGCGDAAVAAVSNQVAVSSNGTVFAIAKIGGNGGASNAGGSHGAISGTTILQTGGGAGGGQGGGTGGSGAAGSVFSGGSAGGVGREGTAQSAFAFGGIGGRAFNNNTGGTDETLAGGAGNPGGLGALTHGTSHSNIYDEYHNKGPDGTGGIIWIVVGGTLTIGGSGSIQAHGCKGANDTGMGALRPYRAGSGSGGGAIQAIHVGTLSGGARITATGGVHGFGTNHNGMDGGNGTVYETTVTAEPAVSQLTLVSTATTAESAPTKADLVMTYTNGAGTATIGTDLTAEVSADNGSTWTSFGLSASSDQGDTGGKTILAAHAVTISTTIASPAVMRYRIKTLNQTPSKITRIHSVSLGWS